MTRGADHAGTWPGTTPYLVVVENQVADEYWPLWTTVSAGWTFRSSSAGDAKALPLLTTRFDPKVDLRNRASAGTVFTFPAYVERQGGRPRPGT